MTSIVENGKGLGVRLIEVKANSVQPVQCIWKRFTPAVY
jgi:hypothetical protein